MSLFRRKPKSPDYHEQAHAYATDIQAFSRLRGQALQRVVLQPTEANRNELRALDEQIKAVELSYQNEGKFRNWVDNHLFWTHKVPTRLIIIEVKHIISQP